MGAKEHEDERLGDLLIRRRMIKPEQLDKAVQCQVLFGGRLGTNLLELGFVTENKLRRVLEEKYQARSANRTELKDIPREITSLIPRELADRHKMVPVRIKDDAVEVAMLDPGRESAISALHEITSLKIVPIITLELDIYWALEKYYAIKREARYINLDRWLEHQRSGEKKQAKKETQANPGQDITGMEGVPRNIEDFWDRVGRTSHPEFLLPRVLDDLNTAVSRKDIGKVILDFSALFFKRALLFVVNEDMLFGWDGRGEGIDSRNALAVMLPLSRRSVFKTVVETGAYFLGPIPDSPINRRFLAGLGPAWPKTAILLPLLINGKVAAILYGDMGDKKEVVIQLPPLQSVLNASAQAFHRLIMKSKSENPAAPVA